MTTSLPLEIDCASVKRKLDSDARFVLVDCRERDEHALVHIDRALLFPMTELADRVGELQPYRDREIAIHCHHGGRSLQVAQWLRQQGFAGAQSMAGGIDLWAERIDPTLARY